MKEGSTILKRLPPDQEREGYLQTVIDFDRWCDDHRLPTKRAMVQAMRSFMRLPIERIVESPQSPPPPKRRRRSVAQMIAAIESAKKFLAESDLKIEQIAHRTGFSAIGPFCRDFKHHAGQTPGQFRTKHRKGELTDERSTPT